MVRDLGRVALLAVINDILDFSKIEAGKLDLERVDFDLRDTLGDTVEVARALRAQQKGLELACHVDAATCPTLVGGDPGRLRQVLVNLVGNAIKFTERGRGRRARRGGLGRRPTVACGLHLPSRDTGHRHPARTSRQAIFEAFTQADGSTTRQVRRHRAGPGDLAAAGRADGRADLGRERGRAGAARSTSRRGFGRQRGRCGRPTARRLADWSGLRVLVVDDNATNRADPRRDAGRAGGCSQTAAGDGAAAPATRCGERRGRRRPVPRWSLLDAHDAGDGRVRAGRSDRGTTRRIGRHHAHDAHVDRPPAGDAARAGSWAFAALPDQAVRQSELLRLPCRPCSAQAGVGRGRGSAW